jgi:hypothetical protein
VQAGERLVQLLVRRQQAVLQADVDRDRVVAVQGGDVLPDQVIPNRVAGAPTSGTEPLIAALGLMAADASTASIDGVRAATRFLQGAHGSLLDPSSSAAATVEMQGEMASMIASYGEVLQVTNASVLQPAP